MNIQPLNVAKGLAANRQNIGPGAAAASVVAALAGIAVGLFSIADCVRFQTKAGQCDSAVRENAPQVFFGGITLLAVWGGYWTPNPGITDQQRSRTAQTDTPQP